MIKILSWNIQAGGGARTPLILKAIIDSNSTIVVLSEFRNNDKGQIIRAKLLKYGYRFQAVSNAKVNENSVAILSLIPFSFELFDDIDVKYSANLLIARFKAFNLIGGYFPHKKKHDLFSFCLNHVQNHSSPFIITGDFNSGINGLDQKGNSFWYEPDLKSFEKYGYFDAFRLMNGEKLEYSWFSNQNNGYRYDHFYAHHELKPFIRKCYYLHEWRNDKWSDHSPMFLEIG